MVNSGWKGIIFQRPGSRENNNLEKCFFAGCRYRFGMKRAYFI